ncbi:MAG: hypothetical protein PHS14_00865 [Elusimicrobia bacterium]|nr:hypothetical protein [Elusimicrobiota bacterium]
MKTIASNRRRAAPSKHRPKRRPARRAHAARPAPAEERPLVVAAPYVNLEPDKRDDELSDEESLDREERHALY